MTFKDFALQSCPDQIQKAFHADAANAGGACYTVSCCRCPAVMPEQQFLRAWFYDDGSLADVRLCLLAVAI